MILLPSWNVTRKAMESYLPFVVLAAAYVYLFISSITPENAAATGWIHFLVMDLFVGRWIYWEGQKTGVWTIHSLALCLFAGPMGLLSHIFTTLIFQAFSQKSESEGVKLEEKTSLK